MVRLFSLAALSLTLLQSLVTASPFPCLNGHCSYTRANLTPEIVARELGPQLSRNSSIFGPDDARWVEATTRYQEYNRPHISMVVEPAREDDIPKIVKYANKNSLDFLTVNRGHSLSGFNGNFSGIQISMDLLRDITINKGGKTAWFQGGTYDQQVIDELFEQGYVATTGSCSCVGMMGPGLGGGHGRYQGRYGLISDNLVTLHVVLADGTAITVSEKSHPDLLWAMKGAGHNFGIVTSFELNIYPRLVDTWYYRNYVWTQDKLETVFEEINRFHNNGTEPVDMAYEVGVYTMNYSVSSTEAVIWWSFAYSGSQEDAQKYLTPFDNIEAVSVEDGNVPYPEIPGRTGSGLDDFVCSPGYDHMVAQVGTFTWNVTTQRQVYDLFNQKIQEQPAMNRSSVTMEGYSTEGVRAVDARTSGFPWRDAYNHLGFITIAYPPDASLDEFALEWRVQHRDLWNQGQPGRLPTTYVNYAWGDEPIESVYGYEPWRLEKLRSLKAKYDPHGRFNHYNPITRG
ncbi:hypothetical protein GGS23DRAFT_612662 [Durotheca rogersii]|uniref:uncharacterized protein n=1 Tax=Durotheca rogersii TaxID=419775 RepID=UPI00221F6ED4|nr:uncharacterized protein GGS23DRAFT_612662 [Durotheca rogersii]KAI5867522.1 hypothetical protein GGS23DRAFT_612662 [Durotheca rogersii]